jgi:hypothetical protein
MVSVSQYDEPAAERREATVEALASVRAEGLEPTAEGLALLEAISAGAMTEEQALEQLRQGYLQ